MTKIKVTTGIDALIADGFSCLKGKRIGLITHAPACDSLLKPTLQLFLDHLQTGLKVVFTPEHGFFAHAQDLESVSIAQGTDGLKWVSLYGNDEASLHPLNEDLVNLDVLVIDLVDVGSRYYTFQATMLYAMQVAFAKDVAVMILDRPNPLGGLLVEGPMLLPEWSSFVGVHPIPIRHGLTIGELAILYMEELVLDGELEVVPCEGWKRGMYFDETGLPWVMPSPNMPTLDTALVYPGQCLLEGTNLSEGRGTTHPFQMCGAPFLHPNLVATVLSKENLPGVAFRPVSFKPTFQKWQGEQCGGVELHVTDRAVFQPVRTSLALLHHMRELSGKHFAWRIEPYEFIKDKLAIDLLFGSDRERMQMQSGMPWRDIIAEWAEEEADFLFHRKPFLIYLE
jgi:uncharacterized protein YbbC (DUF1343 family)